MIPKELRSRLHKMDGIREAIIRLMAIMKSKRCLTKPQLMTRFWFNQADPGACDMLLWWQKNYVYRLLNIMRNDQLMQLVHNDRPSGYTLMRLADYSEHPNFVRELELCLRRGRGFSTIPRRLAHVKD